VSGQQQHPIEKRRHPRIENNIPLKISTEDVDLVTETKNISCSGAYCWVNKFLEPMTKMAVTLLIPFKKVGKATTKKIVCGGVVVRTENIPGGDGFNTAIFFNDIHPRDTRFLAEYVQNMIIIKDVAAKKPQH
jgi:hypothetical protein